MENRVDIFVIGGGINGTAIAADAAGRSLSVALCEQADLASGTSSASTKLIHGGLRYLEHYEFGLVKKALNEREILLKRAPHLILPLEFVLPHESHMRPAWLIRLGLFFYDHLAKRLYLPGSKLINFQKDIRGETLLPSFEKGFSYYDCFADDARLTLLNAISAKENGADILTRTSFISAKRKESVWEIVLRDNQSKKEFFYYSQVLVNAAGPWINEVQKNIPSIPHNLNIKLVKGSHIIVPKLFEGDFAYILQNKDHRIIFAIPYESSFTLIGTTDILLPDDSSFHPKIIDEEIQYLCGIMNHYFKKHIAPHDVVSSYSGIRCLQEGDPNHPEKITRDYKLLLNTENNTLPLLTVIGGKITTHRLLAEAALNKLKIFFQKMGPSWTSEISLPGGNIEPNDMSSFRKEVKKNFSWLPDVILNRYIKNYGKRLYLFLQNTTCLADLGIEFGPGLYQKEVEYLQKYEWAESSDDILWRRTKLGLHFSKDDVKRLDDFLIHS